MKLFKLNTQLSLLSFWLRTTVAKEYLAKPVQDTTEEGSQMEELEQLEAAVKAASIPASEIASAYRCVIKQVVACIADQGDKAIWLKDKVKNSESLANDWSANQRKYWFNRIESEAALIGANPDKLKARKAEQLDEMAQELKMAIEAELKAATPSDADEAEHLCAKLKGFTSVQQFWIETANEFVDYARKAVESGKSMRVSEEVIAMARQKQKHHLEAVEQAA